MISLVAVLAALTAAEVTSPARVIIATTRGEHTVAVASHFGYPVLSVHRLSALLPIATEVTNGWAAVEFGGQPFRFLLGAPVLQYQGATHPLVGGAYQLRDSLFVPLQWLSYYVPNVLKEGYRYDPLGARFEEIGVAPVMTRVSPVGVVPDTRPEAPSAARRYGLRFRHRVVVDAGHGGADVGTIGRYLPRGVQEKHVALAISLIVRDILEDRGIDVVMTRTHDVTLVLEDRAPKCQEDCDLFVSIHVNALNPGRGVDRIRGFETYFLPASINERDSRLATMAGDSGRFGTDLGQDDDVIRGIMLDLARNEYLVESAELADRIHTRLEKVHPGGSRRARQKNLAVLRYATRPAALIETGYSTNPDEGRYLSSKSGQIELATAIADGIIDYLLAYEAKSTLPSQK